MSLAAGRLRHRVTIQNQVTTTNSEGERETAWLTVAIVWASIEPLSAREFVASQQLQSAVNTRITIRYRPDIIPTMRLIHKNRVFTVEGVLEDKESGIEYMTLPCSSGLISPEETTVIIDGGSPGSEPGSYFNGGSP